MTERKHQITFGELNTLVNAMRDFILLGQFGQDYMTPGKPLLAQYDRSIKIYAVPRGGIPVALALAGTGPFVLVDDIGSADIVVDDLIDSGATRKRYRNYPFYTLIDKRQEGPYRDTWVEFPWEQGSDGGIEDNIVRLLQYVGEDPTREGLLETPGRVAKAWQHWCGGYELDPADVLKVFEDGAADYDEMVVVKDLPFYSKCEHHLADIFGTATIAYIPNDKNPRIVGLSKLDRLLDVFARRLQVQERLTAQVANALMEHLQPKGAGVVIKARHMCMESRGVRKQGHHTITSALRGVFREQASTRAEFLALANN
jgi:GTP cyclohydrolase I